MSVAIVGAAAIGVAGTMYASNKSSSAAKRASKQSSKADAARLAFEREQYDEWQATYGDIEDSLADYYDTLSPTLRTVQGLEAFEKEKNIALTNLRENLDQRGIGTSGIAAQHETTVALSSASERARIRAQAPMDVAREKASFLQVGLGQDPTSGMSNALQTSQTNAANIMRATAQNAGAAQGAMISSVTDLAQAGLEKGLEWYKNRPANPGATGGGG